MKTVYYSFVTAMFMMMLLCPPAHSEEEHDFSRIKQQREIKGLLVSKSLFTPNKWWRYEGRNEDLPCAYAAEQYGRVSLGGRLTLSQGALVTYRVLEYTNAKQAHQQFLSYCNVNSSKNVRVVWRKIPDGQEGKEYRRMTVNQNGKPVAMMEGALIRYGNYVVLVTGRSNLGAFGPKPKSGERKWMCEPVYENVLLAVRARWKESKTIPAEYEKRSSK